MSSLNRLKNMFQSIFVVVVFPGVMDFSKYQNVETQVVFRGPGIQYFRECCSTPSRGLYSTFYMMLFSFPHETKISWSHRCLSE